MRRVVVPFVLLAALAAPSAALPRPAASGADGTLVVKNGTAPQGTPVVVLVIRGAAIGQIAGAGRISIRHESGSAPEVTGYDTQKDRNDTERMWRGVGPDFKFRAVGGLYKITIWGSGVDLVASGVGNVILNGSSETPFRDGSYSLNGRDFRSLPAVATAQLPIGG